MSKVLIYYPSACVDEEDERSTKHVFLSVPVDTLINPQPAPPTWQHPINGRFNIEVAGSRQHLNSNMSCIAATTQIGGNPQPCLYFFGGVDKPPAALSSQYLAKQVMMRVHCYNMGGLPNEVTTGRECNDMISAMCDPILVRVGDDCIYVIGYGKSLDGDHLGPTFLEYNFVENRWTLLTNDHFVAMFSKCDHNWLRDELKHMPHVMIGQKLHVSIMNSSYSYDTVGRFWEDCKLFKSFWPKQKEKNNGLSPLDFYGSKVWTGAIDDDAGTERTTPFGFYGKGILWNNNILLGVYRSPNCTLVSFLLDDTGSVFKSQPISLNNINLSSSDGGACLVDLGQAGRFGLLYTVADEDVAGDTLHLMMVTFQISRPPPQAAPLDGLDHDDDHFLECQVLGTEVVAYDVYDDYDEFHGIRNHVFCV